MRPIKLASAAIVCAVMQMSAATDFGNGVVLNSDGYFKWLPKSVVKQSSPRIFYMNESDSDDTAEFVLLDNNFNEVKKLKMGIYETYRGGYVYENLRTVWDDATQSYKKEWEVSDDTYTNYTTGEYFDFYDIVSEKYHEEIYFTQNVFNDDDLYEFIVHEGKSETDVVQEDRDGDGEIDFIGTTYSFIVTGYKIVNENGVTVARVTPPAGWDYSPTPNIWKTDDGVFMLVRGYEIGNDYDEAGIAVIYKINKGAASLQQVSAVETRMTVNPRVSDRTAPVTVALGDSDDFTSVEVVDASGRVVMSVPVSGEQQIQIPTSRLNRGVYVVKASNQSDTQETCKIIVR